MKELGELRKNINEGQQLAQSVGRWQVAFIVAVVVAALATIVFLSQI
jgi:hypothetical protein